MSDATINWPNRIVGHGEVDPNELLANPRNWRIHPTHQQEALASVLSEVGWVQTVLVNQRSGYVIDGHLRVALALKYEEARVPVSYVDLSYEDEALILATLDPLSAMAAADAAQLDALMRDISTTEESLQSMLNEIAEKSGLQTQYFNGLNGDDFDPDNEWQDMPEFHQDDQMPHFRLIVNFQSDEDVQRFSELVEQPISTERGAITKSIWYPAVERNDFRDIGWVSEGDDED